jgi:hypothetical protein
MYVISHFSCERKLLIFVKTIAFALIDTVESRAQDLQGQASALGNTLDLAINRYQGITNVKRSLRFAPREIAAEA